MTKGVYTCSMIQYFLDAHVAQASKGTESVKSLKKANEDLHECGQNGINTRLMCHSLIHDRKQ